MKRSLICEILNAILSLAFLGAMLIGVAFLTGCSTGKALFDACRDGLCR